MIIVYTGKNGSGKSLTATKRVNRAWYWGRDVYTNIKSFKPYRPINHRILFFWVKPGKIVYFQTLSEIYHVSNAIIFIDEAAKLLNARMWDNMPLFFCERLREQRKLGLDVITTTPSLRRILVDYRELVGEWWYCRRWLRIFPIEKLPCLFLLYSCVQLDASYSDIGTEREAPLDSIYFMPHLFIPFLSPKIYNTSEVLSSDFQFFNICLEEKKISVQLTDRP